MVKFFEVVNLKPFAHNLFKWQLFRKNIVVSDIGGIGATCSDILVVRLELPSQKTLNQHLQILNCVGK